MSIISKPNTFTNGATIIAAEHYSNFDTLFNDYNGNITNSNLSASAAIVDTKLTQISTAGKVSGAALTNVNIIPSSAGVIPIANLASGTPDGTKFVRHDGTLQTPNSTVATQSDMETASSIVLAVTPGRQQYHPGMPKAWF